MGVNTQVRVSDGNCYGQGNGDGIALAQGFGAEFPPAKLREKVQNARKQPQQGILKHLGGNATNGDAADDIEQVIENHNGGNGPIYLLTNGVEGHRRGVFETGPVASPSAAAPTKARFRCPNKWQKPSNIIRIADRKLQHGCVTGKRNLGEGRCYDSSNTNCTLVDAPDTNPMTDSILNVKNLSVHF